jgi:hypothetical protein
MIKRILVLGIIGSLAICADCATKPAAAIASQSEAVCIGSNMDRDIVESQKDIGWTLILPSDDSSGWSYPAY